MFSFPKLRRHVDRPADRTSDRRRRAGRCPVVESLEGRKLLSGIVGNHIGVVTAAIQGNHIGYNA
jgi:hypothetical protein